MSEVPFGAHGISQRVVTAEGISKRARQDLYDGARNYELWGRLAFHEIRQRFRRSVLGPLWLTLSMGIVITAMGVVFSALFHQQIGDTLPYIAAGLIFWGLLTNCITDGTMVFIASEGFIRNVPLPISIHYFRMIAKNVIIFAFNMIIYVVVFFLFHVPINFSVLLFIPGFIILLLNAAWISLFVSVLSTRYRDIPQIITNLIQVVFFITPVFWSPETMSSRPAFITFNPFYHLLEIVRAPLLGVAPPVSSWAFCLAMLIVGGTLAVMLYQRAYARIAYWV